MNSIGISQAAEPRCEADLVVVNAVVHTLCETQPVAEAVAASGNRILAVGDNGVV